MIDLKNSVDLILGIFALVAIVYRISHMEAAIYREIDKASDEFRKEIHLIQMDLSAHKTDYVVRKEWQSDVARGLKQMIKHKSSRLNFHIIDIQRHLEKQTGFIVRSQPVADPDEDENEN
ncbi:hypothetical protein VF14_26885 [Nostoc linckia z18]|jgi:hypothetical protein|uniref:Uncharacterized protein n=3 Tax=Nostoc linckia TaxID=92942 RepID=A0A9Q6EJG4_NOSLI|nr:MULTISPECIES: hypothetical protein [Nostoc]MBL1199908.1 hypothetical protein [Nostoc sp. GBBB01]PHK04687.1 hypothetical protein VF09_28020 [Nostoc linckia z9]PHK30698.1 hypothetical protein VF14_26885 [Nostoc linckia z18]PHK38792.1 hypothetical protein VF12_16850 [Nostoc linckia z15]PHK44310.1 hypothetical protein VF13_22530 [Nostoc linckia z16]